MARWRAASLIGVHVLAGLHLLHWKLAGETLAPVEPSEMFDTLHLGIITVGFLFMAGLVVATAFAGRFFCGWGCHILALQDLSAWLLRKLRVPTKAVRSRVLVWTPALAAAYLFVWPQVERWMTGAAQPSLRVISNPDGWTSFTTTDLLRSFPGPVMTTVTFVVCGFVIVYFLGSRSFCAYACPYGAIFAAVERAAPLRVIAGPGACSQCGLCIESCQSGVKVIEEVNRFGAVTNTNCMRDLDCVSVCPTDALKLGVAKPPLLNVISGPKPLAKEYDFTPREDALMAVVFVATLPVVRGLYDAVSFLLALAVCALLAYATVVGARLLTRRGVRVSGRSLKEAGRLTWAGRAASGALVLLAAGVLHSALVRYHVYAGDYFFAKDSRVTRGGDYGHDPDFANPVSTGNLAAAIVHYESAEHWGLVTPRNLRLRLASLYANSGDTTNARNQLNALLAKDPDDIQSRLQLAQTWRQEGRYRISQQQANGIFAARPEIQDHDDGSLYERRIVSATHGLLGDLHIQHGEPEDAAEAFEMAIRIDPQNLLARLGLGATMAANHRLEEARDQFVVCTELAPDFAAAHNNLASVLSRLGLGEQAIDHYRRAIEIDPDNVLTLCNAGNLLLELGEYDEADRFFKNALSQRPDNPEAQNGMKRIAEFMESEPSPVRKIDQE